MINALGHDKESSFKAICDGECGIDMITIFDASTQSAQIAGEVKNFDPETVMDAREVVIIVNGHNKARALRHAVEEPINHMWTISALQMHPKGIIVCDYDACAELKVGTYKYFLDIEKDKLDPDTLI